MEEGIWQGKENQFSFQSSQLQVQQQLQHPVFSYGSISSPLRQMDLHMSLP